jgi:hypothetical protein
MSLIALGHVVTAKTRTTLLRSAENRVRIPEDFTERVEIPITRCPLNRPMASVIQGRTAMAQAGNGAETPAVPWICYRSAIALRLTGQGWGPVEEICEDLMKQSELNGVNTDTFLSIERQIKTDRQPLGLVPQPEDWTGTAGIRSNLPASVASGAWTEAPHLIQVRLVARSPWLDLEIDGAGLVTWLQLTQGLSRVAPAGLAQQVARQPESLQIAWGICDRLLALADRQGWPIGGLDLATLQRLIQANSGTLPLLEGLLAWSDGLFEAGLLVPVGERRSLPVGPQRAIAAGIDQFYRGLPIAGALLREDEALRSAQLALLAIAQAWLATGFGALD